VSDLSERWFGRYSDDYWDLTTTRAFLMGLVGNVLHLIAFVLLLALSLDEANTVGGKETVTAVGYLLVIIGGVLVGGGSIYRFHTSERVEERSRKFSFRTVSVLGFFGLYWLLASYRPTYAVWFAICYLIARTLAYIWIYVAARL
jgi:uncharacterized membrane protein YidH (DUF202 family)